MGKKPIYLHTFFKSVFFRTPSTGAERREQYLTYLLVSIVAVFLFCHSLKFFLLFYKELDVCAIIEKIKTRKINCSSGEENSEES